VHLKKDFVKVQKAAHCAIIKNLLGNGKDRGGGKGNQGKSWEEKSAGGEVTFV